MRPLHKIFYLTLGFLILLPMGCDEKESSLGVNLQDPFTLYSGTRDTAYFTAGTLYDDSLSSAGYTQGVFGHWSDPYFGQTEAVLYSQISLSTSNGYTLSDEVVIDSVIMTLVVDTIYPRMPGDEPFPLHIVIRQLADTIGSDSAYLVSHFTTQPLAEEPGVCFFDSTISGTYFYTDTADTARYYALRLRLRDDIYPVLRQSSNTLSEFLRNVRGFSLHLESPSNTLVTVDFSATATNLRMYIHSNATDSSYVDFVINSGAGHCMYYRHDYTGTALQPIANHTQDSLEGSQLLYMEPLGGTRARLNLQPFLDQFCQQHPLATVHYAELLLPISDVADTQPPRRLLAYKRKANGSIEMITDANVLANPYTYAGYDGYYQSDGRYYRMRITRHLQELLREGKDYGTELMIDARRATANRTLLCGTATTTPPHIVFVYSE